MTTTLEPPTGSARRSRRLSQQLVRVAEAATTPYLPADFMDLFAPLRSGGDLRGRIESVTPETADAKSSLYFPAPHLTSISGMDTCLHKKIVATASHDGCIKVWDYEEGSLTISRNFAEGIHSLALHPSGLHIFCGFTDALRLLTIMVDTIKCAWEAPAVQACREASDHHIRRSRRSTAPSFSLITNISALVLPC